ncbi:MAG: DUF167 domain-containing protein [Kiritimatiellae bacterium]|nr:DUF167 domain-containing protein [Kiritimatiellia bacterium]
MAAGEPAGEGCAAALSAGGGGTRLRVHAVPRASRTEIAGFHGGALRLRLAAPPVDGRANDALCRWAADFFGIPKKAARIESGASGREKTVFLEGVAPAEAAAALEKAMRRED